MYLPIEYTGTKTDLLSIKELREYWKRYEIFDNIEQAIYRFNICIDPNDFKHKIQINGYEYRNVYVGWKWREKHIDECYHNILKKIIAFFDSKIPQFSKFVNAYKNFTNFCIDYHYMLLLILQKSNSVSNNYIILSLFKSQANKQQKRHNGEWISSLENLNVDNFLVDYMDYTHVGLGLAALYIFMNENYINRTDVKQLLLSFKEEFH